MKGRVAFLVAEIGLAHLTESLAIADELVERGYEVVFALPKRKKQWGVNPKIKFVDINPLLQKDSVEIVKLINDEGYTNKKVGEDVEFLRKYKPDYVVIDYRPSAVVACAYLDLPAAYVTVSAGLPGSCYIPNPNFSKIGFTIARPLLRKMGAYFMWRMMNVAVRATKSLGKEVTANELINRMTYIAPEFKGYLPKNTKSLKVNYVGPIFWKGFSNKFPKWLSKIKPDGRTVYLTFGGTGFDKQKLIKVTK